MAAMTPEELYALIEGLIIDNTTNQITPAKTRAVLKAIVDSMPTGASVVTGAAPVEVDPFTSVISIPESSENQDGFLSNLFFKKFNRGVEGVPASDFRLVARGYQGGVANEAEDGVILPNDICVSFRSDNPDGIPDAGVFGFFQFVGSEGDDGQDPTNYIPVMTSIVNVA